MENYIIIGILVVVVLIALVRSRKHFKGGGCCGSTGNTIRSKKTLTEPKIGEKIMTIEGMTCENCEARVENALNRLDGVAAKVNWKKKSAVISYSTQVSDEVLKDAVERMGYQVTGIQ